MEPTLLQTCLQLGALGILAYVAIWLTKWLPKVSDRVCQTFVAQQEHFDKERDDQRQAAKDERDQLVAVMQRERQICLDQQKVQLDAHRVVLEKLIDDRSARMLVKSTDKA